MVNRRLRSEKTQERRKPTDAFTHGKEVENENDDEDEDDRGGAAKRTKRRQALRLGHAYSPW